MAKYRVVKNQGEYKVQEFFPGCSISGAPHAFDTWDYLLDNKFRIIKGKTLEKAETALREELEYKSKQAEFFKKSQEIEVVREIEI